MAYTKCTKFNYRAVKNSIIHLKHDMEAPVRMNMKKKK